MTFTHHTSAEYIFPLTLCSDPSLSLSPQWKWNCSNLYFCVNGPPDNSTIKDTTAHFIVFVSRSPSLSPVFPRLSTWLSHKKACGEISAETSMQKRKKLFIAEILRTGSRGCSGSDTKEFATMETSMRIQQLISVNLDGAHNRCKNSHQKPSYSTW